MYKRQTERRLTTKKPFLANELWHRLSHEDKQTWGKLSSGGKIIILHGNKERDLHTVLPENNNRSKHKINKASKEPVSPPDKEQCNVFDNLKRGDEIPQSDVRTMMSMVDEKKNVLDCNITRYLVSSAKHNDKTGALLIGEPMEALRIRM